jgi:death on curing protein
MQPEFLDIDDIIEVQQHLIETYGGEPGLRDSGLLQSAMAMPQSMFGGVFLHEDLYQMAAAYLFHIVKNHPFVDGNKRAGAAAAIAFLDINSVEVRADQDDLAAFVLAVAEGKHEKAAIAEYLSRNSVPTV